MKIYCSNCTRVITRSFENNEPQAGLCKRCLHRSLNEDYGMVRSAPSHPKPVRYVMADCVPGKSTGNERLSMCYGHAENANGLWDNLVRAIES